MSFLENSLNDFLNQIDSSSPTPGGGSASALSSLLGVALARMVGHVTVNKKSFQKLDEETQKQFLNSFDKLENLKQNLLPLIDEDAKSFDLVMEAYRLPKITPMEKATRVKKIQDATLKATEVPLQVAKLSLDALFLLPPILSYGNKNALSDVKVAMLQLYTAIKGALLNVSINLPVIDDETKRQYFEKEVQLATTKLSDFVAKHPDVFM